MQAAVLYNTVYVRDKCIIPEEIWPDTQDNEPGQQQKPMQNIIL